jgi:hypothetical protein
MVQDHGTGKSFSYPALLVLAWLGVLTGALLGAGGCGEKIALPEPKGLFGVRDYLVDTVFVDSQPVQLAVVNNNLFVLSAQGVLTKRHQKFGQIAQVLALDMPTALCADDRGELVFVWEQGAHKLGVYSSSDLTPVGDTALPHVQSAVSLATSAAGIDSVAGARTFLYISDPDSGVIHRYAYFDHNELAPHGILARAGGDAARFVHLPAGLCRDAADSLLVCDADSNRNWVIRFNPRPDYEDTTPDPSDQDPWRGRAALFSSASCNPPAASDYTLGNAAGCDPTGWIGGPSSAPGEFTTPQATALDGSGRIYVADTGNDRIQIFSRDGYYEMLFGTAEPLPGPTALGVVDVRFSGGTHYGAYVFVLVPSLEQIVKFISYEEYYRLNLEPPPEPN